MNDPPTSGTLVQFQCCADDYLEARHALLRARPLEYWLNRAWGPTLVILGLVAIARDPLDLSGYLVAAVGVALVLNGTVWLGRRARLEWHTIPRPGSRTWLTMGDAVLRLTTVNGHVDVSWSTITQVVETTGTFVLRAPDDFHVVPKRAFTSAGQLADFRARLAAACPHGRRSRATSKGEALYRG